MVAKVLRTLVVLGLLGSAWIHYELWQFQYFSQVDVIGPLFLVNAASGVVIAFAILAWRHWLPVLLAIGFGALTMVAFVLSLRAGGFFGVQEEFTPSSPNWLPELWAVVTEAGCVVFGIALLSVEARSKQTVGV
ncbi:hypothetical protein [Amycolatopsis taiwanensis]|uniref:Uncharacterized protein n=1 Tax=Amycolatopsis taiwanensis TaxID=342230 RepID=A0A9W6VFP0_9PSEU|nr:hypothetical protein [Amycolatopsis taiwanensis]GLY65692.1 hypothetical protein Atai01_23110 [Amycolatopsis taiwanensis]